MLRLIGGTIAGVVTWVVVVSIIDRALRYGWPAYAGVEKAMTFTLAMKFARLAESAASSLASGAVAGAVDRGGRAALVSGIVILLFFLPLHYQIWDRFPVWYHLIFLISLPLLAWLGGKIVRPRGNLSV